MLNQYANVSRLSNTFVAQQRERLDSGEVEQAKRLDAVEPLADTAWREVLRIHGALRHAILLLRIARENSGKGYRRVALYPGQVPAWFESRMWTPEFVAECQANVLWFLADRKAAWTTLRWITEGGAA